MPAPSTMHFYRCTDFADRRRLCRCQTLLRRSEPTSTARRFGDLTRAGCRYVQLDEVAVAMLCDPEIRATVDGGRPRSRRADRHLCGGDQRRGRRGAGRHDDRRARVPGQFSWPLPLGKAAMKWWPNAFFKNCNVSHFLLEYDTARAGDFRPLRFVPPEQGRRARLDQHQNAGAGDVSTICRRRSDAAGKLHRPRSPRHRAAMRLCLDRRRQSAERERRTRKIAPGGGGGAGDLGLTPVRLARLGNTTGSLRLALTASARERTPSRIS